MSERILIIGAGFAGMWSALGAMRLLDQQGKADGSVEVAVIAPQPELHIRPRLYEKNASTMKAPLSEIFANAGVRFIKGYATAVSTAKNSVTYSDEEGRETTIGYSKLVLATGSVLFRPDIPGLAHAFNVDQLADAAVLEEHISELARLPESRSRNTVVVAGGGFTGIETAAEMPHRLRAALGKDADVRVVVVERNDAIGPDLGPGPRPVIEQAFAELGVETRLGEGIIAIDPEGVTLASGERIDAATVVWTAGARANPITKQIDAEKDAFGRLHVDRNLKVIGHSNVYATGDVAYAATDDDGNRTKMSCQHAQNLGRSAGHNVAADLLGVDPIPYSQEKYVTCLDLGPWGAVYTEGWDRQIKLSGAEAKRLKTRINTEWIYPPSAERAAALAAADPLRIVVA
ncbi:predicted NADH dehydrogenase, FAD-containing subunit (plasmid) [Sinorhizobium fredii NGR234]|uniref:NADH Dehydrogenase n=1 Tax=Sinorhizobium fredii (strain NBRC 101917 / NGR234) TaxID=394 RepID=Q6W181_SINFN|nr:NAD(P)/FAD-dependent oxidoreductase [Sinorhizobium fredii]AAQ87487.1 NADH Dehydrogenase [Sinorhizobium fredii NGR234]ACP22025.1 predicted NADH dehydrogenase, FAD-containing subunit [Sinorhizobium fredii NGR234]